MIPNCKGGAQLVASSSLITQRRASLFCTLCNNNNKNNNINSINKLNQKTKATATMMATKKQH